MMSNIFNMSDILKSVSDFVLPCIFLFTGVGVLCAICALCGVWRDSCRLKKCGNEIDFSSDEQNFDTRKIKLDECIQKFRKGNNTASVGEGKLLQLRLETIRDALDAQSTKLMPSLHDLHSLSEQDEMSRRSSCWLRTITSFLLIMGILGTLTGVHKVLGHGKSDINILELGRALQPSMYAVFFTIILMWLRGWYVAKLDGYLEKLDLFTMTKLMPFLQPMTDVASISTNLIHQLAELKKKEEELATLNTHMNELQDNMKKYVKAAAQDKESIAMLKDKLDAVSGQLAQGQDKVADLSPLVQSGKKLEEHFEAGVTQIETYVRDVEPRCEAVVNQYNQLVGNLDTVSQDVAKGRATAEVIKGKTYDMNQMGQLVDAYNIQLSDMSEKVTLVEYALDEVKTMKDKVTGSQNLVNDSSKQADEMLEKVKKIRQDICDSNTDFSKTMSDGKANVEFAMNSLEEKLQELRKVSNELQIEWKKKSSQIAL